MSAAELVISPRWLIPVVPKNTVLENHSVVIAGGRILDIVPTGAQSFDDCEQIELPGHALIPGLVNMHGHSAMTLLRGIADDRPLMEWLEQHIWPLEGQFVNEHFCRIGVRLAMAEMLRGGVTCFNDMYFYPEATAAEASDAGMRAQVGMMMLDFPSAYGSGPDDYFSKGLALHDAWSGHALVKTCFAPHAPYTVSDAPLKRIRMLADELDLGVHMHVHETAHEVESAVAESGQRPLARLDELGLLGPRLLAVHATQLSDAEIHCLADAGSSVVHCPESNMKLASGFCPTAALADAGVNLCIGTDGTASNNDLDMLGEMRSAALIGKAVAARADALPAPDVLAMATINGAKAMGLDSEIGSIEPGKWADLAAIDLSEIEQQPNYEPVSQIVYASGRRQFTDVWVAGRHLVSNRELTSIDTSALMRDVAQYQEQIAQAERNNG